MNLIIVESPTKAKTFKKILSPNEYHIQATLGHFRDLPEDQLAVDLKNDFKPFYIINKKKESVVRKIKELALNSEKIILATDADREGESIAYHVAYVLGFVKEKWPKAEIVNQEKIERIIFHEITKEAIKKALSSSTSLNLSLVNAQQARRILDRIVGYTLSPLLWEKVGKKWLSAGRVQTVALRFIVAREREISSFLSEDYYIIYAQFKNLGEFKGKLIGKEDQFFEKKVSLNLFDGQYTFTKTTIGEKDLSKFIKEITNDEYFIDEIKIESFKRYPSPPLITSTMQQEASKLFGYSSIQTMKLAQDLYEQGLITYHRTDSYFLAKKFIYQARNFIEKKWGKDYLSEKIREYKTKSKLAQEAHEAIRPTNLYFDIKNQKNLTKLHYQLYQLIFKRAVATQMKEAQIKKITIRIKGKTNHYLFESKEEITEFEGFLKIFSFKDEKKSKLSFHKKGDRVFLLKVIPQKKTTLPPPRYTEASLIKTLEEKGIGRPSTYAPIIATILERHYVEKKEGKFFPTNLGITVCDYLCERFPEIFDVNFTAKMEEELDLIAQNKKEIIPVLQQFYQPFLEKLNKQKEEKIHVSAEEKTDIDCPECKKGKLVIRFSRFGKFYACSNYPACRFTQPFFEITGKKCPNCGKEIVLRYGKNKKKFYTCINYPNCKFFSWRIK